MPVYHRCHTGAAIFSTSTVLNNASANFLRTQWRREGVCRPGQTSVLPPLPIRSGLQSGYFQDFVHRGCEPTFGVPSSSLPFYYLPIPRLSPPILHPFHSPPLKVGPLNPAVEGLRSAVSSQRGLGRSPGRNRIWCILALRSHIRLQQIYRVS